MQTLSTLIPPSMISSSKISLATFLVGFFTFALQQFCAIEKECTAQHWSDFLNSKIMKLLQSKSLSIEEYEMSLSVKEEREEE